MFIHNCALLWFVVHYSIAGDKSVGFPEMMKVETVNREATVTGKLPVWLKGYYLRQLCGALGPLGNSGETHVSHFFDCLGMVGAYRICPENNVKYSNKYYSTKSTAEWENNGKNLNKSKTTWNTLFTDIDMNIIPNQRRPFNPNMDFWMLNNTLISISLTTNFMKMNIHNLNTVGNYDFVEDLINEDLVVNGPTEQVVDSMGTTWGTTVVLHDNKDNTWDSFRLIYYIEKNDPTMRKIMSKFPLNTIKLNSCKTNPHGYMYYDQKNYQNYMGYMHTFAVTDSYVILPVSNYVMNPCFAHPDARKNPTPLFGAWFYTDARRNPLTLLIFHKSNGKLFKSVSIPSSSSKDFISHIINAYQVDGHVFLDTMTFQDQRILTQYFQTTFLLNNIWPTEASLVRYFVNTTSADCKRLALTNENFGTFSGYFPAINRNFFGRPEQQYVYIVRNPYSDNNYIWKFNIKNGKDSRISKWKPGDDIFITEPVFVSRPNSTKEEDGVLLVGGFNSTSRKGLLYVLDALNITKILAKIDAPGLTPFGTRNTFVKMDDYQLQAYCNIALTMYPIFRFVFSLFLFLFFCL